MRYNLPERVETDIISLAKQCNLDKVVLFGSRARGSNRERSDIDLAITGGDTMRFREQAEEAIWTLLSFDIVEAEQGAASELSKDIQRDGVVIYEKAR